MEPRKTYRGGQSGAHRLRLASQGAHGRLDPHPPHVRRWGDPAIDPWPGPTCAYREAARRRITRLQGQPAQPVDPLFRVQPGAKSAGAESITLGELIEQFSADKTARLSPGKVTEYDTLFRLLRELWGEAKPVRDINRADCRAVRDLVAVLPPHATKRWPNKTLIQVAEQRQGEQYGADVAGDRQRLSESL